MALSAQDKDPARAHALAPYDGRITATLAERELAANLSRNLQGPIAALARRALRQDPTAVKAVSVLGLQAQLRNDTYLARGLFDYADRLSRRELQPHLWAIEDAVSRGDIPTALRHYDMALRTSKDAPDLLFPVLGKAIAEPDVRRRLVPILVARPVWAASFIDYLANGTADPLPVANLLLDLRRARMPVSTEASRAVVAQLIRAGSAEAAWRYYAVLRGVADRRLSRDPEFTARIDVPTPLDWVAVNEGGITTSIDPGAAGGIVDFAAPSSIGGEALRQMQMLPPGRYRITGRTQNLAQPERSAPYWTLTCWQGRELGRVAVPNSNQASGTFAGTFAVPSDCPVQTLALVVRSSDMVGGVSGQLAMVHLGPQP